MSVVKLAHKDKHLALDLVRQITMTSAGALGSCKSCSLLPEECAAGAAVQDAAQLVMPACCFRILDLQRLRLFF